MKNFFKKLSFVLAIAMVLTGIAPAAVNAAESYIYKRGNDTVKESVEVWFGDAEAKRDLNVKIDGKKNVEGTWKVGNTKIATIDENGVVTPVKNGTTTVKFTPENGEAVKVKVVVGTRSTSIRPYVAEDETKTRVSELTMTVGEEKNIWVGIKASNKAKAAGATESSFVTDYKIDGTAVEVTKNTTRKFVFKAVEAGEATITIGAGKETNKFVRTATIKVTVADELAAEQTGVKKITVTGSNLTDKVADYAVKRGSVSVTLEKVELNEDKTSAVLVAASTKYPKGTYTVTFGGETTDEFEVVDGKLAKLEVNPNLVLDAAFGVATSASVTYKAYNQFNEDITKNVTTLNASCTLGTVTGIDHANGVISVGNISSFYQLGTAGKVIIIDTAGTGVTVEADVTLSAEAVPADVQILGVLNLATNKPVALKANQTYPALGLMINVVDQYGNPYTDGFNSENDGDISMIVNPVLTGFAMDNTTTASYIPGVGYVLPITSTSGLKAGTVNFIFVLKGVAKNVTASIEIAPTQKVASIEITPTDAIYYGETAKFDYEAYDTEGNAVTSILLLTDPVYGVTLPAGFSWSDRNFDGVAELSYDGTTNITNVPNGMTGYYTGMVSTVDYTYTKTVQFTYGAEALPAYVLGVKSTVAQGVLSGHAITLDASDMNVADQYGRVMRSLKGYNVVFAADNTLPTHAFTFSGGTGSATFTGKANATEKFSAKLVNASGVAVENSDTSFTLLSTVLADLTNFEVESVGTIYKGDATSRKTATPDVYGYSASGVKVYVPADSAYYTQISELNGEGEFTLKSASASAVGTNFGEVIEKEYAVKVVINNAAGTAVNSTVKVGAAAPVVSNVFVDLYGTNYVVIDKDDVNGADLQSVLLSTLNGVDQYSHYMWAGENDMASTGYVASVEVTDLASAQGSVVYNNTNKAVVSGVVLYDSFTANLTFVGGYTYSVKVIIAN